ncbi:ATP-binding protein [Streptomyces meridianus]|uniref:ATP-binding protein n=1 Tax=Streptomyces meridianus TaxID=2938945 RepID=A0ABT0XBN5_9ACTN|nr:ATP-binding protein [Streptomyces meridianus]MCM2579931.1 ATP-binding protein [Streptomyces meridianus]
MVLMESSHGSTAEARRATADFLSVVGGWVDVDAVVLVVSELVTNAARHTAGWWRLRVRVSRDHLVVDVEDASPVKPQTRRGDLRGGGGLGLPMVQRLAGSFEVVQRSGGKTVRARWALSPAMA